MEWTEEQEACAKKKVSENSQPLPSEKQGFIVVKTNGSYCNVTETVSNLVLCDQCVKRYRN